MKRTILFIAIIFLVVLAVRLPLLGIPFERDEGGYAYIAWRMGFHELPYRDWIDQKPPGIFWVYHLGMHLPLDPVRAIHFMALLFSAASACALYFLAVRFISPLWAMIAAVLFVLLSVDPLAEGTSANTEIFMQFPLILSQIAVLRAALEDRRRIRLAMLAGAFAGIAVAFKQVAIFDWPLLVFAYWLFATETGRVRRTLAFAAWSAAGAAAIWGVIAGYFMLRHGLKDLIFDTFTYNLEYVQALSRSERFHSCVQTVERLSASEMLVWAFAVAGFAILWMTGRKKLFLYLAAWTLASITGICASGYYFPHYFQQILPVLCLAAALGAAEVEGAGFWTGIPAWVRRAIPATALFVLPLVAIAPYVFIYSPKEALREMYPGNALFAEMPDLGKRIAEITGPNDRVFIFGADPEVLFYARRASATRYIFLFNIYGPESEFRAIQMKTAAEVAANQPAAALYLPNTRFDEPGNDQYFTGSSKAFLKKYFHIDTYLAIDPFSVGHLVPGNSAQLPRLSSEHELCGALLVKNSKSK